jgi:very-short-patch-repair endonuclease
VQVLIGSEALAAGTLTRHELRMFHRRLHPDVYAPKQATLTLEDRIAAAWLWSGRRGVVCGLAAAALHGAKWVDDEEPVELGLTDRRPTAGVITRNCTFPEDETMSRGGMELTTVERTAFDLARSGLVRQAVAGLDALAAAAHFKHEDVRELARRHKGARRIRRLDTVLDLVDAGAESPQETRVRLLLLDNGFPRPRTQIPVPGPTGFPRYYLDMGWEDILVAVEYDGEHHRKNTVDYRKDIVRLEYIQSLGWIVIRVVAGNHPRDIVERVRRARASRLR